MTEATIARPKALRGDFHNMPPSLAPPLEQPRWLVWRWELNAQGKWTKVPYQANRPRWKASSKNPATWSDFASARATFERGGFDGVGFALIDSGFGAFDLDDCRNPETDEIALWAQEMVAKTQSYAEVTPSGTGLRIIGIASGNAIHRKLTVDTGSLEIYRRATRYICVTGAGRGELVNIDTVIDETITRLDETKKNGAHHEAARKNGVRLDAPCPADLDHLIREGARVGERSEQFFRVVAGLKDRGFTVDEVEALLAKHPEGIAQKYAGRLRPEIERCFDKAQSNGARDTRPTIRIEAGDLERVVDNAEAALIAADRGLYQRGGVIVCVGEARVVTASKRESMRQRIAERGEHALVEDLTSAAIFERFDARSNKYVTTDAPMKIVNVLRQRTCRLRLPVLSGVINAPTLRVDGSVLSKPGYDPATGLLFASNGAEFPAIPDRPSHAEAKAALDVLMDLIHTFPFVSEADRAVAISAILTACVRPSLRTAPAHAYTAPTAGSGKSMLVDLASVIATGREAGVIAQGKTEEEMEKRLGALFLAGDPIVAIDNCEAPLGGEFLCQVCTQPFVRVRILGKSEAPELPATALITATGNNLTLTGDMTRRALLCSLDPKVERPELRAFDTDPIAVATANRGRYVAAALTIMRAFVVAGRPRQADPLGSFEAWSDSVRGALLWLGCADPVQTMEQARVRDPRLDELQSVMTQWGAAIGPNRITVREVVSRAEMQTGAGFAWPDFREALLAVAGAGCLINSKRLGKWLSANKNRIVNGCFFEQCGLLDGVMTWRLYGAPQPRRVAGNESSLPSVFDLTSPRPSHHKRDQYAGVI